MRLAVFLLAMALVGCKTYSLDEKWEPLEQIVESKTLSLGLSQKGGRVIGETYYVWDLSDWMDKHPEPKFTATLLHEQLHAVRQRRTGVFKWIARYVTDMDFAWKEEQLGYYKQIIYLRQCNVGIVIDSWAKRLARYNLGLMVSYDDAREWLTKVVAGQWHPPSEDGND